MGLLPAGIDLAPGAAIDFDGERLPLRDERRMRALRGSRMAIVFQDPMACLNPFMTVGAQTEESLQRVGLRNRAERRRRADRLIAEVEPPAPPHTARRDPPSRYGDRT